MVVGKFRKPIRRFGSVRDARQLNIVVKCAKRNTGRILKYCAKPSNILVPITRNAKPKILVIL